MRFSDQYFWNLVFTLFFVTLVVMATVILETEAYLSPGELDFWDLLLISLASFRMIRLFVYDAITKFFREQFWNVETWDGGLRLAKPAKGPRRTIADLLSCPWCFGAWSAATVTFFYLLTPYAFFPVLLLAVAGVATLVQLFANKIGWEAEDLKRRNQI